VSALVVVTQPTSEPVSVVEAKNFLRVSVTDDDALIAGLIQAAREMVEAFTGRSLVRKQYRQSLDAFPYYTDSIVSQNAYPPSYYALPRYSTTLWNYSQLIKLFAPPLVSVDSLKYIDPSGTEQTLDPSKYIVDSDSEPARIFPAVGQFWPPVLYVPNAVKITFTAGFTADASQVPQAVKTACLMLVANFYENREAAQPGSFGELPNHVKALLWSQRVLNMDETRG
jgi:uncharacterized phiE125 gp8 family phage protein